MKRPRFYDPEVGDLVGTVPHPDAVHGATLNAHGLTCDDRLEDHDIWVCVERPTHKEPSRWLRMHYGVRKWVVRALGGTMRGLESEIGGPNPEFTEADVDRLSALIAVRLGRTEIERWNGEGCHTVSLVFGKPRIIFKPQSIVPEIDPRGDVDELLEDRH